MPRFTRNLNEPLATYDLHLHTYWSYDAENVPLTYFERARALGVRCIAVTEHFHIDSQPELKQAAADYPDVRLIPAAELSLTTSLGGIDVLCYGFPDRPTGPLQELLVDCAAWQGKFNAAVYAGVRARGFEFTDDEHMTLLRSYRPDHVVNVQDGARVQNGRLRDYLIEKGIIADVQGYNELFKEVGIPPYPAAAQAVPALKDAGIFLAIAHPPPYFDGADRERMDTLRDELQLDGIECAHTRVPPDLTPVYRDYCVANGLFSVAGSDSHFPAQLDNMFARHHGPAEWLDEFLERLDGEG